MSNKKTFIFQGMCYSGKSTLGKMIADILGIDFLDSRDLFFKMHGISEIEFLKKFGREKFIEAEKKSLYNDFKGVFSLGGSAIYYPKEMKLLKEKYDIIWLNVDYNVIVSRKKKEAKERPIVYPDGIENFKQLYDQRKLLYKDFFDYEIRITQDEPIQKTIQKILLTLINN
ncbi:MAG TPA: hypothetical protein EYO58_02255 [Flavobacteriales bacterium]|nr:hypothetical protein [Flavobacteriales bacterium]